MQKVDYCANCNIRRESGICRSTIIMKSYDLYEWRQQVRKIGDYLRSAICFKTRSQMRNLSAPLSAGFSIISFGEMRENLVCFRYVTYLCGPQNIYQEPTSRKKFSNLLLEFLPMRNKIGKY